VLSRRVGADDVEICRTSQPGAHAGAWQTHLGDRVPQQYTNSMRVTEASRFFVLDATVFAELVNGWFPMAVHLLEGHVFYRTDLQELTAQRERQLALGSLSAGLSHELNNPAGAAVRAAAELRERVAGTWRRLCAIAAGPYERGTGVLTVRTGMDRDQVVVVIGDTGPGVPSEIRDRIFDPLFTTKPVGLGTGLGLDVTWRIVVNNHHGDIQVHSVPGDTQFRVRLPTS